MYPDMMPYLTQKWYLNFRNFIFLLFVQLYNLAYIFNNILGFHKFLRLFGI